MKNIVAFIPARGGSKGIPGKNLHNLAGKPLVQHTIEAALEANLFNRIIVSSDSTDVLQLARTQGVGVLQRPDSISGDSARTSAAVVHAIQSLELGCDDVICLLQPTSPLRDATHIKEAFTEFQKTGNAIVSIGEEALYPDKYVTMLPSGRLSCIGNPSSPRQESKPSFKPNGAIYIFSCGQFTKENDVPVEGALAYKMSKLSSIDIDDYNDLYIAEKLIGENSGQDR